MLSISPAGVIAICRASGCDIHSTSTWAVPQIHLVIKVLNRDAVNHTVLVVLNPQVSTVFPTTVIAYLYFLRMPRIFSLKRKV